MSRDREHQTETSSRVANIAALSAVYAVVYLGSAELVKQFSPPGGYSPWYPPAGVLFAWVAVFGPRWLPWTVVVRVATIAIVSPNIWHHQPGGVVARAVVICGAYTAGAWVLRRVGLERAHPREFVWFASVAVLAAPFVAATGVAAVDTLADHVGFVDDLVAARVFWIGDALAIAAIVPVALLVSRWIRIGRPGVLVPAGVGPRIESSLQAGLLIAIPLVAMNTDRVEQLPVVLLLIVLPLLWVALRHDIVIAAAGVLASVGVASFALRSALGDDDLVRMQVVLLTSTIAAMFAAASRRRTEAIITELGQNQAALRDVNERLNRSLEHITASTIERATVFSAVAHDAKAPLAAIALRAETMSRQHGSLDDELALLMLHSIGDDARSVTELLVGATRAPDLDSATLRIQREQVNLFDVCFREVSRFRHGTHTVELRAGDGSVVAWADRLQVERMVSNLVSNARQHTPPGTHVELGLRREGDRVVLWVDDDGPGFPGEVPHASDGAPAGENIGLFIVARFAEFNDAHVRFGASERGGARVELDFPAASWSDATGRDRGSGSVDGVAEEVGR